MVVDAEAVCASFGLPAFPLPGRCCYRVPRSGVPRGCGTARWCGRRVGRRPAGRARRRPERAVRQHGGPAAPAGSRRAIVYGVHPPERWAGWQVEGARQGRPWAAVLGRRLADVAAATGWVAGAFAAAHDYVLTHRDLEPWNVLVTPGGPVLVDWDLAGEDSAGLVADLREPR